MRRSLWLLPVAVLAGVAAIGLGLFGGSRTQAAGEQEKPLPKLVTCGTCHSMEKEVTTWEKSPHASVACLQCHDESDVAWVKHELSDLGDTMAGTTPTKAAHTLPLKAPDAKCKDCHADQMKSIMKDVVPTPMMAGAKTVAAPGSPMPIKAAHAVHMEKVGLSCSECHTDSVHGTTLTGTALRDEAHEQCMSCHVEKKVQIAVTGSTSCTACHADVAKVTPEDHKNQAAWQVGHGKAAATQSCGECHLGESAGAHSVISQPTSFPSASKDSCAACHSGVQMPHPDGFVSTHGKVSLKVKDGTCEACHTDNAIATGAAGAAPVSGGAPSCTGCHAQPMPHPASFLSNHGQVALTAPATCDACHSRKNPTNPQAAHASGNFCASCHDAYQHPAGWVAGHGSKVDATCATCHTMQGQPGQHNACASCHAGDKWHPDLFFVSHAREVEKSGKEACMTCHNEVQPSCTQCHRNP